MNVLVFGASKGGEKFYDYITKTTDNINILAFTDNNPEIIGNSLHSIPITSPEEIINLTFDKIFIAAGVHSYIAEILAQLKTMGIAKDKIVVADHLINGYDEKTNPRVRWMRDYARHVYANSIQGNVAECGVFKGHFAHFINKYFYNRKLYLFDTFEGFPDQDMNIELGFNNASFNNSVFATTEGFFNAAIPEVVMSYMPYPENCDIKKGYFPETAVNIEDSFCFVNLDMDLYKPMLDALHFFWDKMVCGGIILLHDYYHPNFPSVARAISDFEMSIERRISKTPIGDFCSIALIKND